MHAFEIAKDDHLRRRERRTAQQDAIMSQQEHAIDEQQRRIDGLQKRLAQLQGAVDMLKSNDGGHSGWLSHSALAIASGKFVRTCGSYICIMVCISSSS